MSCSKFSLFSHFIHQETKSNSVLFTYVLEKGEISSYIPGQIQIYFLPTVQIIRSHGLRLSAHLFKVIKFIPFILQLSSSNQAESYSTLVLSTRQKAWSLNYAKHGASEFPWYEIVISIHYTSNYVRLKFYYLKYGLYYTWIKLPSYKEVCSVLLLVLRIISLL
jgi:hypothetical protein